MKLSLAIATGRVLMKETNPETFCGCALAMGLVSVGKEPCPPNLQGELDNEDATKASRSWCAAQEHEWPWIREQRPIPYDLLAYGFDGMNTMEAISIISALFFEVDDGHISLDQLVDWIASVEPAEPSESEARELRNERAREAHYERMART